MSWPNSNVLPERADCLSAAIHACRMSWRGWGARIRAFARIGRSTPCAEMGIWASRLDEEKQFFRSLARGMETEFLATGKGLMGLAGQMSELQAECGPLNDLTLGRTKDGAVQFAFQLLKQAEDLGLASYEQYDQVFAAFAELQPRLAQLAHLHKGLVSVLLPLNFITTSFRIEASRHPHEVQEIFFRLAAKVNETVTDVRVTLERQFEELATSQQMVEKLVAQVSASLEQHRKTVSETLADSRRQLRALSQELLRASAGASGLSQLNQSVTRHIGGLVMAQQCEDINRQKIEHVCEAMDAMGAHLDHPGTPAADRPWFIFQAAQIQLQQTQNVFGDLNLAAGSLKSGIQNLRSDARAATDASVNVGSTLLNSKSVGECQAGIGKVLAIIQQVVQTTTNILAAFEPLQARFLNCTHEATGLANDVRHSALNAQLFAIHVVDGATLEVLAVRMRMISDETMRRVGELGGVLEQTGELVQNLRQRLTDFKELSQLEQTELARESAISQTQLTALESALPMLMQRIARRQERFGQAVEAVLAEVRFPGTIAHATSRSIGFFQDLVTWGGKGGRPSQEVTGDSQQIEQLKSKYTMASERQAHTTALQPVAAPTNETPIELFGETELSSPAPSLFSKVASTGIPTADAAALKLADNQPAAGILAIVGEPSLAGTDLGDNVELF